LYNVRKRTQHLPSADQELVMRPVMDMHFSTSLSDYSPAGSENYASSARSRTSKTSPPNENQWLAVAGRYRCWQAFHFPSEYATTNNPCENFNASTKPFFQRRRLHKRLLLLTFCELLEKTTSYAPVLPDYLPQPTSELIGAGLAMIDSNRVLVQDMSDTSFLRVRGQGGDDEHDDDSFRVTFDEASPEERIDKAADVISPYDYSFVESDDEPLVQRDITEDERDGEVQDNMSKQVDLYNLAIKWSLRRAHWVGMPDSGWIVDVQGQSCACKYFAIFRVCAHVVVVKHKGPRCTMHRMCYSTRRQPGNAPAG
jgi:hypothetical protein